MSVEEVVELAAAGRLYGLEPFDISQAPARELRVEAERERPTNGGPKWELDRPRAIAEATLARVEAMENPTAERASRRPTGGADHPGRRQGRGQEGRTATSKPTPGQARLVVPQAGRRARLAGGRRTVRPAVTITSASSSASSAEERGDTKPAQTWTE